MANNKKNIDRSAINLLPTYFRTDKNSKFLSSTIDQLTNAPALDRIDGFVGSRLSQNYNYVSDNYINTTTNLRSTYELEPGLVINELTGNIKNAFGFDDLVNQLNYHGADVSNLNRLFKPRYNAYDPKINWDKLINFRDYYWLSTGPDLVTISGAQKSVISTYTVTDSADKNFFVFTPDGLTEDPVLTLYRGCQYIFNINSVHKLFFKTQATFDNSDQYTQGIVGNGTKSGQIVFTVDDTTPSTLFYSSDDNVIIGGSISVKSLNENSTINVEQDIIGKSTYSFNNGLQFVNGLKIKFIGNVYPLVYANKEFIVEGVGDAIKLIDFSKLTVSGDLVPFLDTTFDETPFDQLPFDDFNNNVPLIPEYITINKSSIDLNPWSRYNRWFHKDVIDISNAANNIQNPVYPNNFRAVRPIIEFNSDIQLYNYGNSSIGTVDYIDTFTSDAFSLVEGSAGYHIDGTLLQNGDTIIFAADKDPFVNGNIYQVKFVTINSIQKLSLIQIESAASGSVAVINAGLKYKGSEWWFDGSNWIFAQQRTSINQAPLFDLFDINEISYSNSNYYSSDFAGNRLFGYSISTNSTVPDSVLGFPLNYISGSNTYLFSNFFSGGSITLIESGLTTTKVSTSQTYLKFNSNAGAVLADVWADDEYYDIPVIQFQTVTTNTSSIELTVFDNPATINDLNISVFVDDNILSLGTDYTLSASTSKLFVNFTSAFTTTTNVLFKCVTAVPPNSTGVYETPLNLTNNPLNGDILNFTLSELTDHVNTMVNQSPDFTGVFPGLSNLGSLPKINKLGTRLIKNQNPLAFAHCFITDTSNNLISAIRDSGTDYYQFKLNLINMFSKVTGNNTPSGTVDLALSLINANKNSTFSYAQSDMLGYGDNKIVKSYKVKNSTNNTFSLSAIFDINKLSSRSVLIYKTSNGTTSQLMYGIDYNFEQFNPYVTLLGNVIKGDIITVIDYNSTIGSYIPPTPTKLGLYPKYQPMIYVDNSFDSGPVKVIQGHDGSITMAFSKYSDPDDFRDLALLEYETRIFNNIKVNYNSDLINIDKILPTIYNNSDYSLDEINKLIQGDFLKWASVYGVDFTTNLGKFMFNDSLPGNWRGVFKYYFGTDRPNITPWEMLGFTIKPTWWDIQYGPAPYTSGNLNLWSDLEAGIIRQGTRAGTYLLYARPGLTNIIPVDTYGNIIDIATWAFQSQGSLGLQSAQNWKFGDVGPAEASWRRSSHWPFAVQIILALTKPADYSALMFDVSRLTKDITGKYYFGANKQFLTPSLVSLNSDIDSNGNILLASGYGCWVIEYGKKRTENYIATLKQDLKLLDFNLIYKGAGFYSKDKLEIIIDSVSPNTPNPGVTLPNEDYTLHFNISNPVETLSISGIIVEKNNGQFVIKGYDKVNPYFSINNPVYKSSGSALTVGGKSEIFITWAENSFYQQGQIVYNAPGYYRVVNSHNSGVTFDKTKYAILKSIPVVGGASVLTTTIFEPTVTQIPYGSRFGTIQEIYNIIIGYGNWLESKGFIFNEYNSALAKTLDWNFTGQEFLYWTTQNWADGTIITLSPFANTLQLAVKDSVVDNVLDSFYNYSLLTADGQIFPPANFSLNRENQITTIATKNSTFGIFFAKLNLVQKEHVIVLNNTSMFNDIIYDIETGYRQLRIRLIGFKTANWDGDFVSPGFVYDDAQINNWSPSTDYKAADIVKYAGKYYSAINSITGVSTFDFTKWNLLGTKPVAQLLPNFEYKINQFEDFYSLDIDNFDASQQAMAQHLTGYTPRAYLDNIFVNPIAQYKFYQGYIREKGTKNAIDRLAKASMHNLQGKIAYSEEWAFRIGSYGGYTSFNELEFPLRESDFRENSQIITFVDTAPVLPNDFFSYIVPNDIAISADNYSSNAVFLTTVSTATNTGAKLPVAGYVRSDDITATAYNNASLLDIANNGNIYEGNTIWIGFTDNQDWDVYRYTKQIPIVTNSFITTPSAVLTFTTDVTHNLSVGDIVSVYGLDNGTDGVYIIRNISAPNEFDVDTLLTVVASSSVGALLFKFVSVRLSTVDEISALESSISFAAGELVWVDTGPDQKWKVYKKSIGWDEYRTQEDTVDLVKIKNAITLDTLSNSVVNYLDIIDPIKGRIAGIADQEIKYKTAFDPAIYSIGIQGAVVDNNASWIEDHVGELWWDLSTVKYVWYEQGDLEYRKNSWGNLFPGTSIDIYEWVQSDYLPNQWSSTADTVVGLTSGVSGQPKYPDNSVISVKQYYNALTDSTSNIYFYWVKNTVIIPNVSSRRLSANDVASVIYDPAAYGNMFVSVIAPSAITVTNMKNSLISDQIHLNISSDDIDNNTNKHTEWLLLAEGSANSMPNTLLEKKLIDSLLGVDSLGNIVPDPMLSDRLKYGISIRPRQSMFIDRRMALRNMIDYTNKILATSSYIVSDIINFTNLNSTETIPEADLNQYDILVENNDQLATLKTIDLLQANINATIDGNGRITSVDIVNAGYGYQTPPTIIISGDKSGAILNANIDSLGRVISVDIVNAGNEFIVSPNLVVRPFTAIVQIDNTSGNKWASYQFVNKQWLKTRTQQYNTTLYWDYINWQSSNFDYLKPYAATVNYVFEVDTLNLAIGDYVKINNQGNGRFIVLQKIDNTKSIGTFNTNYDVVYSQNGAIRFNDSIWNLVNSEFNWDNGSTFDQTLFDQEPTIELLKILTAIKQDIFVGPLKSYWNNFFFKAVKYAMSEQNFLDWAFKTSFINVTNQAGELDQRNTYKLQNSQYYEDYISEVKPYHSKVRNFQTEHTITELPNLNFTDFDLPIAYEAETNSFVALTVGDNLLTINPYKQWADNYKFSVETIEVTYAGSGYTIAPIISIIPAPGDTGAGATAIAYLSKGNVIAVQVTNPGSGYTITPSVIFSYGGPTDVIHARAYARLVNDKVRSNLIGLKFDRISYGPELFATTATDVFSCNGISDFEFPLTWAAANNKENIDITLNGITVLAADYTIETTSTIYVSTATTGWNIGYHKLYSIIRLTSIPEQGTLVVSNYRKNIELYNAADRISDFYAPTSGMPGKQLTQLMSGLEFSGTQLQTLALDYSVNWGVSSNNTTSTFGVSAWADDYEFYTSIGVAVTADIGANQITLDSVEGLTIGQYAGIINTSSTSVFADTTYVEYVTANSPIFVTDINQFTNVLTFNSTLTQTISAIPSNTVKIWTYGDSTTTDILAFSATVDIESTAPAGSNQIHITPMSALIPLTMSPFAGQSIYAGICVNGELTSSTFAAYILSTSTYKVNAPVYITEINSNTVTFNATLTQVVSTSSEVNFWTYNYNPSVLDTIIDGGSWASTGTASLIGALGINPEDINLIGDQFLSPITSYGPEEFVPGEVRDSLAINVFTRTSSGSPVVMNKTFYVVSTTSTTVASLGMLPPNDGALTVTFNNEILHAGIDYNLDYGQKTITLTTQSSTGLVGVSIMGIGGIGFISNDYTTVSNTSTISVKSFGTLNSVGSVYVTLDGHSLTSDEYTLSSVSDTNNEAIITITGISTTATHTAQAWFYQAPNKGFSEIREEDIITTGTTFSYVLKQYPGNMGSLQGQSIVELDGVRLIPPNTSYYTVIGNQNIFLIDENNILPPREFDMAHLEVYINNVISPFGLNYIIDQPNNSLIFSPGYLKNGDQLAITSYAYADYHYANGSIHLNQFKLTIFPGQLLRVTTFTNGDGSLIRTETFKVRSSRQYLLSRTLSSSQYVWVTAGSLPLVNNVDFYLANDNQTIIIGNNIPIVLGETITIMSMTDRSAEYAVGYRLFKDIFGRTQIKRLSSMNSTRLTRILYTTDTMIYVENSDVLPAPNITSHTPGVVIIAGERIEYMERNNNVLTKIRRGTFGTGAKDYPIGTIVIDQGVSQTIPYSESVRTNPQFVTTISAPNISTIFTVTNAIVNPQYIDTSIIRFSDLVEVYYGGRLLRKIPSTSTSIMTVHNSAISYDSGEFDSDTLILPEFDFTYVAGTGTSGTFVLEIFTNTGILNITEPVQIAVFSLQGIEPPSMWYTPGSSNSLLDNASSVAQFLRERPAALPDKYQYGQF